MMMGRMAETADREETAEGVVRAELGRNRGGNAFWF